MVRVLRHLPPVLASGPNQLRSAVFVRFRQMPQEGSFVTSSILLRMGHSKKGRDERRYFRLSINWLLLWCRRCLFCRCSKLGTRHSNKTKGTHRKSAVLEWISIAVQISNRKSDFGFVSRALCCQERRASQATKADEGGNVWVSRGVIHRLSK